MKDRKSIAALHDHLDQLFRLTVIAETAKEALIFQQALGGTTGVVAKRALGRIAKLEAEKK